METQQSIGLNPWLNHTYGRQNVHTIYENNSSARENGSFRDSVRSALKTTESMEKIFAEASQQYGVPLNLLKAIGKAESGFNAQAVSSAGAQGVMQLMPSTARSLGVEDSFDARSNIMGGAKYIAGLLERYQGDTVLALSAYNAGSGNVEKYGGVPPFAETRNYIQKVLAYAGEEMDLSGVLTQTSTTGQNSVYPSAMELLGGSGGVFSQQDAQYLVELMRLQMETAFQTEMEPEEEESILTGSLFG